MTTTGMSSCTTKFAASEFGIAPSKGGCFAKGLLNGGIGSAGAAILTAAVATVAAPEVVSAGLLIAGGAGAAALIYDFAHSGGAGRAYDAGVALGGALAGGGTSYGTRFSITGETGGPSGLLDFSGLTKITNPFRAGNSILGNLGAAFSKGPDLLGGGAALAGAGSGASLIGKGNCQ